MSRKQKIIIALVCIFLFLFSMSVIGITGIQNSWNVSYDYISYANTAHAVLAFMLLCLSVYGIIYALLSRKIALLLISVVSVVSIGGVFAITTNMYYDRYWQRADGAGPAGAYGVCGMWSGAVDLPYDYIGDTSIFGDIPCIVLETPNILTLIFNTAAFSYGTYSKEYIIVYMILVSSQVLLLVGVCTYSLMSTPRKQ